MTYSPADVVRFALIELDLGNLPPDTPWPIYAFSEPDAPDDVVTLYDTTGRAHGKTHYDGESQLHHGIQVRVRAARPDKGYTKAKAIATALDQQIDGTEVTVDRVDYRIHAAHVVGDVLFIGKEIPESKRSIFVLNILTSVRQL